MAILDERQRRFLAASRAATLGTLTIDGRPRLVPVCFVVIDANPEQAWIAIDEKPKSVADPHDLARVRDIERDPRATLLVDRWSEDWTQLAWLRCDGHAALVEPSTTGPDVDARRAAIAALRAKYPQYASHALEERPLVRVRIERARSWGELG